MTGGSLSSDDLVLVTGGAGFIGSNLVEAVATSGCRVAVADRLGRDGRWKNLQVTAIHDIVDPEATLAWLERHWSRVALVLHMGAISATTETDVGRIVTRNIRSSLDLWEWCAQNGTRLIYASSAATYGNGSQGFVDDDRPEMLARLRPLNAYGWSKHVIDRRFVSDAAAGRPTPPQWAGLKFFNVYGPREDHKGDMRSLVNKIYPLAREGQPVSLFKSYDSGFADGEQARDFVHVGDCVRFVLWLAARPAVSGIFNVGTGKARSFVDLARATFRAAGRNASIAFRAMPEDMRATYQYFTQADMSKSRALGFNQPFVSLEEGVTDYVETWLARGG
jgi:ADP-L-glycero-D-manno-heptose 6-epimerase